MAEISEVRAYGRTAGYGNQADSHGGNQVSSERASQEGENKPASRDPRQLRDTARVLGIPAAEFTPRVQDAVTLIVNEMDRVRFELEVCQNHEKHILKLSDTHAYLPVLNRRAFERELSRATLAVKRSGEAGWMVAVMAVGMDLVRRRAGLGAVEFIEKSLAELACTALPPTTPLGAIGTAEFGVLLGEADRALAEGTAARIAASFEAAVIEYEGRPFTIIAHWGIAEIGSSQNPEVIRHAADADQRARAAGFEPNSILSDDVDQAESA
ncbi:MAG: GGDEF domain-containing protein [Pseudomonadota bacterium]|nr:GGDEF domain-containing protein [Pseudomonadota bacterium]